MLKVKMVAMFGILACAGWTNYGLPTSGMIEENTPPAQYPIQSVPLTEQQQPPVFYNFPNGSTGTSYGNTYFQSNPDGSNNTCLIEGNIVNCN